MIGLLSVYFADHDGTKSMRVVSFRKVLAFHLTHYQTTILNSSKLREFADDNFRFDENGRKVSKRVENTVGKREIARYDQFLLFPQCFQKACFQGASKGVVVWESVNSFLTGDQRRSFYRQCISEVRLHFLCSLISDLHRPNFLSGL